MDNLIKANSKVCDEVLKLIAYLPTRFLLEIIDAGFFEKLTAKDHMRIAFFLAEKSYNEGGCPIGGIVVDNESNLIRGKGHNMLVQHNNSRIHGEGAAIADAGRIDFSKTHIITTLPPCERCYMDICILGFPRVVIGDVTNVKNDNEQCLRDHGIITDIVEDPKVIALYKKFADEFPDQNLEDWKGVAAVNKRGRIKSVRKKPHLKIVTRD